MLDKLVIHFKNIIFFKLVVYIICITLFIALIPRFQSQFLKVSSKKEKAKIFLSQAEMQLDSIIEFEANISETNKKYKHLLENNNKDGCDARNNLLQNLALLAPRYNLHEPIRTEIAQIFENSTTGKSKDLKLNKHEIYISFSADSYEKVMSLSNEICSLLPIGALVLGMNIKKIQVLLPEMIERLYSSQIDAPSELIDVSIKVLLREVAYEK